MQLPFGYLPFWLIAIVHYAIWPIEIWRIAIWPIILCYCHLSIANCSLGSPICLLSYWLTFIELHNSKLCRCASCRLCCPIAIWPIAVCPVTILPNYQLLYCYLVHCNLFSFTFAYCACSWGFDQYRSFAEGRGCSSTRYKHWYKDMSFSPICLYNFHLDPQRYFLHFILPFFTQFPSRILDTRWLLKSTRSYT